MSDDPTEQDLLPNIVLGDGSAVAVTCRECGAAVVAVQTAIDFHDQWHRQMRSDLRDAEYGRPLGGF